MATEPDLIQRHGVAMTLAEAAEFLRVHPVTLRRLASRGQVPASKVGSSWRFSGDALTAFLSGAYTPRPQADQKRITAGSGDAAKSAGTSPDSPRQTADRYAALLGLPKS